MRNLLLAAILVSSLVALGCRVEVTTAAPKTTSAPAASTAIAAGTTTALQKPAAAADDWPRFRGPGGMGVSEQAVPDDWSKIAWKVELPGAGTSSPIVFGDRIYLTGFSGYGVPGQPEGDMNNLKRWLACLKRSDGELIWKTDVQSSLPDRPASGIREGHGYASNTPVADADRIYAFFGKSGVFAFDHNGKELWHADVGSGLNGWGTAASPILYKDLVIVNASVESESLVALDKKSGQEVWRARGIRESWNTPILAPSGDRTELVVAIFGKVLAFDPDSGTPLWNCRTDIGWYMVPSLVAHEGIVYCVGGRTGGGLAVRTGGSGDVTASHRIWTAQRGTNVPSPILHNGYLYWAHEAQGIAYCADLKTGQLAYQERLDGAQQVYASPFLADGKIYYLTRTGQVYVVAAEPTFRLINQSAMPRRDRYDSTPCVHRGQVLLRTDRYLYCIG